MIAGVQALLDAYRAGTTTPPAVVEELILRRRSAPASIWITPLDEEALRARARALQDCDPATLPLYGVPFAIKDNIDLAGVPTTAACPAFAYLPNASATVVQRLLDAGAIAVGKTNLDQFATGLVGTRSPYGAVCNAFDPDFISGGSSSGSAVAVALGLAAFALGTDTAGSGRVPAAFNNLVGYKPTLGLVSTSGVVPACRSLDAVSIFALCVEDARQVASVASHFDATDAFARTTHRTATRGWSRHHKVRVAIALPAQREFFGEDAYAELYERTLQQVSAAGAELLEVDIAPLLEAARLLYQGPWLAERHLVAGQLIENEPQAVLPEIRTILSAARRFDARDAFAAQYRLRELARQSEAIWAAADALLLPTAPRHYRLQEIAADPIALNSRLGHYTNFVNLLDMAAVAVPAGFTGAGLPFGVSLIGRAFEDDDLLTFAQRIHRSNLQRLGALDATRPASADPWICPEDWIDVAVCGAHLSGLPLNWQLTTRGAVQVATTHTCAEYRLFALPGGPPARPGLVRVGEEEGAAIEVEVWRMPVERFGDFVAGIPAPLGIGRVRLANGEAPCGFLCEALATQGATDITALGGWRRYLAG